MINSKNRFFIFRFIIIIIILMVPAMGSCSINAMLDETYSGISGPAIRDGISIDEMEIESIRTIDREMEKSYDINQSISKIADELNDPFKSFYFEDEKDLLSKNILSLENIYTEDGDKFCEIKFNDQLYLLKEDIVFNDIYMVQSINEGSVIILKGDEVLTLIIGGKLLD